MNSFLDTVAPKNLICSNARAKGASEIKCSTILLANLSFKSEKIFNFKLTIFHDFSMT